LPTKEESMSHRRDLTAAPRSELDHRAITVAGHVLLGVVWLERRIAYVPDQLGVLLERAGLGESGGPVPYPIVTQRTGRDS
jgi:hypothetical protein